MGISSFNPAVWVFIAKKPGKWSAGASLFAFPAKFCFLFLSLHLFLCFQLPPDIIVYQFVRRDSILKLPSLKKRVPSPSVIFDRSPHFVVTLDYLAFS